MLQSQLRPWSRPVATRRTYALHPNSYATARLATWRGARAPTPLARALNVKPRAFNRSFGCSSSQPAIQDPLVQQPQPAQPVWRTLLMALAFAPALLGLTPAPAQAAAATAAATPAASTATTTVAATPSTATSHLWDRINPTRATVTQSCQEFFNSPEGIWTTRVAIFIAVMYVITRRPDPAKPSKAWPYGPVTRSWLITPQGAVEVPTSSVTPPPALKPAAAATAPNTAAGSAKTGSTSSTTGAAGTAPGSNGNAVGGKGSTSSSSKSSVGSSSTGSSAAVASGPGRAGSPSKGRLDGSPEPGVLAVGYTAAAIDAFAPLGRFITSDMLPAVVAAARSASPMASSAVSAKGVAARTSGFPGLWSDDVAGGESPVPATDSTSNGTSASAAGAGDLNGASSNGSGKDVSGQLVSADAAGAVPAASSDAGSLGTAGPASAAPSGAAAASTNGTSPVAAAAEQPAFQGSVQLAGWAAEIARLGRLRSKSPSPSVAASNASATVQAATAVPSAPGAPVTQAAATAATSTSAAAPAVPAAAETAQSTGGPAATPTSTATAAAAAPSAPANVAAAPAAPPTPLQLNPVYPPSKPYHPRPVSLTAAFRDASSPQQAATGAAGSATVAEQSWTATRYDAPPLVPEIDMYALEAALVSSVVAFNLALSSRQPLPDIVLPDGSTAAARAGVDGLLEQLGSNPLTGEEVSEIVARNLALAVAAAHPPAVQPSAAAAATATTSTTASGPQSAATTAAISAGATSSSPAVAGSTSANTASSAAGAAASAATSSNTAATAADSAKVPAPTAEESAKAAALGVVVEEARGAIAADNGTADSGVPATTSSAAQGTATEAAVARWTSMIRTSPESAVEAVAEVRAVAEALVADVRSSLDAADALVGVGGGDIEVRVVGVGDGDIEADPSASAATQELAAATAQALKAGKAKQQSKRPKWLPWVWAWSVQDVPTFLDPIRQLLSWNGPSVRSKYDPLTQLKDWQPSTALPSWDPLARLHVMIRQGPDASVTGVRAVRKTPKYDAIAQLVEFLATLPELVESAEWAEAAAKDPLRFLIASAAARPASTILKAHEERQARAGIKPKKKSKWSKYDPLADLFAPEVPLGGRWDEVVAEILALEAVCGPHLKRFSPLQVMTTRGGQAFQSALLDFKKMAVTDDGSARLKRVHPAIHSWLQSAGNVSLAAFASGTKLGPVWGVLLLPRYQGELLAARGALPSFLKELERRHPGLYGLLNKRDPEQALVLLATMASWVVTEEMLTSGRPPRALSPALSDPSEKAALGQAVETVMETVMAKTREGSPVDETGMPSAAAARVLRREGAQGGQVLVGNKNRQ